MSKTDGKRDLQQVPGRSFTSLQWHFCVCCYLWWRFFSSLHLATPLWFSQCSPYVWTYPSLHRTSVSLHQMAPLHLHVGVSGLLFKWLSLHRTWVCCIFFLSHQCLRCNRHPAYVSAGTWCMLKQWIKAYIQKGWEKWFKVSHLIAKYFIYLHWSPKEILLRHLILVEITFVFVGDIDVHIQMKLFSQEWIFCQALDGINCVLSIISKAQKHI